MCLKRVFVSCFCYYYNIKWIYTQQLIKSRLFSSVSSSSMYKFCLFLYTHEKHIHIMLFIFLLLLLFLFHLNFISYIYVPICDVVVTLTRKWLLSIYTRYIPIYDHSLFYWKSKWYTEQTHQRHNITTKNKNKTES